MVQGSGVRYATSGDGTRVARAVRCGMDMADQIEDLGLRVRVGIHTGEIERRGDDIGGVAVHLAARVQAVADPGEVVVSRTVTDLSPDLVWRSTTAAPVS